jgi:hypothetical protein
MSKSQLYPHHFILNYNRIRYFLFLWFQLFRSANTLMNERQLHKIHIFFLRFQLFKSADKLMNERQLYSLYSHKDLSVLGIGRMAKGRKTFGCFSFTKVAHYPFFYSLTFTFTFFTFFRYLQFFLFLLSTSQLLCWNS